MTWLAQQPRVLWSVLDGSASLGMLTAYLPAGATVAAATSGAAARRALIAPVTGCVFVRESVIYSSIESAPVAPAASASALAAGVLMFSTGEQTQLGLVSIPGLLPNLLVVDGCAAALDIDRAHPAIAALVSHLVSSGYSNPFGYTLASAIAGYMQQRYSYASI